MSQEETLNKILEALQEVIKGQKRIEKKLSSPNVQARFDKKFVSTREACIMLACSRTALWKMVKAGTIKKHNNPLRKEVSYSTEEIQKIIEVGNRKWLLRQ